MAEHIVFNGKRFTKEPSGYYKGANKRLHVAIWEAANGKVPEGYEIHHRDFNKSNNALENLQCLTHAEHAALHMKSKEKVACICIQCGKTFYSIHAYSKFCSTTCDQRWRFLHDRKFYRERRICERCGKEFETHKYGKARFCSPKCSSTGRPSPKRKLNDEERENIKQMYVKGSNEFGCRGLAKKFGVTPTTINRILNEK